MATEVAEAVRYDIQYWPPERHDDFEVPAQYAVVKQGRGNWKEMWEVVTVCETRAEAERYLREKVK